VICGVGRIEEPLGGGVGIAVAPGGERGRHPPELRERHRDVRAHRLGDGLGPRRQHLGRLLVAAHGGDERGRRVGRGRRLRVGELLGETPRLVGRGHRRVPIARAGRSPSIAAAKPCRRESAPIHDPRLVLGFRRQPHGRTAALGRGTMGVMGVTAHHEAVPLPPTRCRSPAS
jgi:hypothetical protein